MVYCAGQGPNQEARKLMPYAQGHFCLCVFESHTVYGFREKGDQCAMHVAHLLTIEEATTIKFNKVLVTDEACWQCAGPLPFRPRPKQPVWCDVNPFTSREKLHKHMGHLAVCRVQKFFQSLDPLTPIIFMVFKLEIPLFPHKPSY